MIFLDHDLNMMFLHHDLIMLFLDHDQIMICRYDMIRSWSISSMVVPHLPFRFEKVVQDLHSTDPIQETSAAYVL